MSVVDEKSIFIAMKQDGPFAIQQHASCTHPFSQQNRQWVKTFQQDRQMTTRCYANNAANKSLMKRALSNTPASPPSA